MECNKDEALRAKDIAVRKFSEKDLAGAKKFAVKAQNLYPRLEGISHMIATLEVYIAAQNKINGEMDMYGVLGVSPLADEEVIKKQYRKLVLQLHPDKNKFIGADGAFQLVSEAFNFLSDKAKRSAYNSRRNINVNVNVKSTSTQQKFPSQSSVSAGSEHFQPKFPRYVRVSVPSSSSRRTVDQKVPTKGRAQSKLSGVNGDNKHSGSTSSRGKTSKGSTQKASPSMKAIFKKKKDDTFWTMCTVCKMKYEYIRDYLNQLLKCPYCKVGFTAMEVDPPSALYEKAKAAGKQERSGDPGFNISGEVPSKKMKEMDNGFWGDILNQSRIGSMGNSSIAIGNSVSGRANYSKAEADNVNRELSSAEVRKMLTVKALSEIRTKLNEWNESKETRFADKEKIKSPIGDAEEEAVGMVTMTVPDSDFHIFDLDRSESCFGDNQVWATYDNDDGMPRFYAMVHDVISVDPFKVRLSWLNSKSNAEFGALDWVGQGFIKSCGDFWVGRRQINNSLNSFSHRVRWNKGPRGVIQIYPRKGEIWALYKNWSPDWNKNTPQDIVHDYDMVEVLDDYNEKVGLRVASIVKADGFLTVFCKQSLPKEVKRITKEEMFRFSHQVPSYVLTGEEGPKAPKGQGYIELDPAATPSELLQVIAPPIKVHTF
ncbi:DnaJ-like protein subfamily B member 14 [Bienertia sinuspersici]